MWFRTALTGTVLIGGLAVGSAHAVTAQTSRIVGFSYVPSPLVASVGDSVSWLNEAPNAVHTATVIPTATGAFGFDSGLLSAGQTSTPVTLTTAGTFSVICTLHSFMTQTLIVNAAEPPPDVPETSMPVLLAVSAGIALSGSALVTRRRRRLS